MAHHKKPILAQIFFIVLILFSLSQSIYSQENLFPVKVSDFREESVILNEKPQKIVSLAPSHTEIIFALGLEKYLIGRTDFCNYPQEAQLIDSIGRMFPLNLEKIVSLKPDIILAFGELNPAQDIERLREMGFNVLLIQPENLQETLESIQLISIACGVPEKGEHLLVELEKRIQTIANQTERLSMDQKPRIFTGSNYDTIYTPGKGTLFHEIITLAGGQNIAGDLNRWSKISPEMIAQANPDIILVPSGIMNSKEIDKVKQDITDHPGWSKVSAIQNQRIYAVNEDLFYRAGPRLIDGLELLYELFR